MKRDLPKTGSCMKFLYLAFYFRFMSI